MSAPAPSSSDVLKKAVPHVDIDGHNLPPSPAPSSPRTGRKYAIATELVYTESNDQYNASSVPIYQVSHDGSKSLFRFALDTKGNVRLIDDLCRALPLNKRLAMAVVNMITLAPEIPLEPILSAISPRSCRPNAPWS